MREGKNEEGGRGKKLTFSWVQASKKHYSVLVPLWVPRTRGRYTEGGKKREEGGGETSFQEVFLVLYLLTNTSSNKSQTKVII